MSARTLTHLAKYLTRAACNAEGRPISAPLAELLVKDLYEWIEGGRPADVFARHKSTMRAPEARAVELAFGALDRLEARVRDKEPGALQAATEIALRIASTIYTAFESER